MSARIKQWTHGRSFTASSLYNFKKILKSEWKGPQTKHYTDCHWPTLLGILGRCSIKKCVLCKDISFAWNLLLSSNRKFLPIYNWTILDHWAGKECCLLLTITTGGLPQHLTLFNIRYIIKYMFWLIYCRAIVFLLFRISLRSCILKLGLKL